MVNRGKLIRKAKVYGGRRYHFYTAVFSKVDADRIATSLRKQGILVRIHSQISKYPGSSTGKKWQASKMYLVYTRWKSDIGKKSRGLKVPYR